MNRLILSVFTDSLNTEDAISKLQNLGYDPKELSVIMRDRQEASELRKHTGADVAENAVSGATTGGVIGGIAGLLIGVGAIAIPGVGALLIGGPIAAALGLTGAAATTLSGAVTGALTGGLVGALGSLGVPESEALEYENRIKSGDIFLAVPVEMEDESRVIRLLEDCGAEQIKAIDTSGKDHRRDEIDTAYGFMGARGGSVGKRRDVE